MGGVLLATLLAGCDEPAEQSRAGVATMRTESARAACITAALSQNATDDVAVLESTLPDADDADDPAAGLRVQAARAAREFARAYQQHAAVRAAAAAYADSAAAHAGTRADSVRFARRAADYRLRAPEPGTLEGNVADSYRDRYQAVAADADHPCNWTVE